MTAKYTEAATAAEISITGLATLANNTAVVSASISNTTSSEHHMLRDFLIAVGTQGGARTVDKPITLLIVPEVNGTFGDTSTLQTARHYTARYADGTEVEFLMDAADTARNLSAAGVQLPNQDYKVGILNETGQAFAGTNAVYGSGAYNVDDV